MTIGHVVSFKLSQRSFSGRNIPLFIEDGAERRMAVNGFGDQRATERLRVNPIAGEKIRGADRLRIGIQCGLDINVADVQETASTRT